MLRLVGLREVLSIQASATPVCAASSTTPRLFATSAASTERLGRGLGGGEVATPAHARVASHGRSVLGEERSPERLPGLREPLPLALCVARLSASDPLKKGLVLGLEMRDHGLLLARDPADSQKNEVLDGMKHVTGVTI